ncbi:MAG: ABC transporter ATP-binding protein [Deltaproteobacteria bacterium]|jgi:putative ABC transport system ATP-binding protein|nr:ABC transporter ATP-binding protein [Deltaproteobacteria bacterium]
MHEPILVFKRVVKKRLGGNGYTLMVAKLIVKLGDRIALVGQSGSGKSTLLDMLGLVSKPDYIYSHLDGEFTWFSAYDVLDLWEDWNTTDTSLREKIRREDLGYVLQSGGLLPFLNVRNNIILPAKLKKSPRGRELEEELTKIVTDLRIGHLLKKYPGTISMGERQRVAVARAIIHKPSLILADEPTASLDPPTADKVFERLLTMSQGRALIVATHDEPRVRSYGFQVYRIVCEDLGAGKGIRAILVRDQKPKSRTQNMSL